MNSPLTAIRRGAAFALGAAAAAASRAMGRGSGASIRGAMMWRMDPSLFGAMLANRRIAIVSGTNGKTTTTHLLTAALRTTFPDDVVTNPDGGNLRQGIISALSTARNAPIAVLETDEQIVPYVLDAARVEVMVMLNFSRDQLDRHHEINALGRKWRDALAGLGSDAPIVVANANDPLIVWAASVAPRVIWVDPGTEWTQDAALCPECGHVLVREETWRCPGCVLHQQTPNYRVENDTVIAGDTRLELGLKVPGRFNRGNAACALAAAIEMGIDPEMALAGMRTVESPAGRFAIGTFGDVQARLVLAKNPAGWAESLVLMESDPIVLAIDSAIADGTDVSWLWDVEYEQLAGHRVIVTGPRATDLAVRLSYAGVTHSVVPDLGDALAGPHDGVIDVLATYTPFLALCRMGGIELS